MWSLVSSMRLLRKPSKRGEGDLADRKLSKDSGNQNSEGSVTTVVNKVERRESTRIASGASKFLRSLRSGSSKETLDQITVIPLNDIDSKVVKPEASHADENLKFLDKKISSNIQEGQPCVNSSNPESRSVPERSQSFQEKRSHLSSSNFRSKIAYPNSSSGNVKVKHSRPQSFLYNHNSSGYCTENKFSNNKFNPGQNNYEKSKAIASHSQPSQVSLCPDPSKVVAIKPTEKIYENLEIIRENNKTGNFTNTSTPVANIQESKMTLFEKDKSRRSPRKLTKDSGYETPGSNYSDYVNIDSISGGGQSNGSRSSNISRSESMEKVSTTEKNLPDKSNQIYANILGNGNKISNEKRSLKTKNQTIQSTMTANHDNHGNSDGRKLKRSVSEVPPERITLAKLQSKVVGSSKTIYSSISNGLSIWNSDKIVNEKQQTVGKSNNLPSSESVSGCGNISYLPSACSTLPRSSSSYNNIKNNSHLPSHISNKNLEIQISDFTSSTKNNLSVVPCHRKEYLQSPTQLSPSRSTPNLIQSTKLTPSQERSRNNYLSKADYSTLIAKTKIQQIPNLTNEESNQKVTSNHARRGSVPVSLKNSSPQSLNSSDVTSCKNSSSPKKSEPTKMIKQNGREVNNSWSQDESICSPPERDSSSIKQIRYGPGHEKYPSWPIPATAAATVDPAGEVSSDTINSGSSRSKSWTDQTDYPKEQGPSYARPYMKRMNLAYTQQLKTVMEKCERIPPETFEIPMSQSGYPAPNPRYHESVHSLKPNYPETNGTEANDEYRIPSPPERDTSDVRNKSFSQDDLEIYAKKYEEKMSNYAQSEGYHSYISSDSSSYVSSGTPFLDQLRRESESNHTFWMGDSSLPCDPNDPLFGVSHLTPSGRESVTTVVTNSSSNSSGTETLKWGSDDSKSDMSLGGGGPSSSANSRIWEQHLQRSIGQSPKFSLPKKNTTEPTKVQLIPTPGPKMEAPQLSNEKTKSNDSREPKPNLKKFPLTTYSRPSALSFSETSKINNSPNKTKNRSIDNEPGNNADGSQKSPVIDTSKPPSVAERILELEQSTHSTVSFPKLQTYQSQHLNSSSGMEMNGFPEKYPKSSSLTNLKELSKAQPQHPGNFQASNPDFTKTESYQASWKSSTSPNSSNPTHFTYLDTEKKHKVADMTLKAIQKQALLAYYERHTGKTLSGGSPPGPNGNFGHGNEFKSRFNSHSSEREFESLNLSFTSHSPSLRSSKKSQPESLSSFRMKDKTICKDVNSAGSPTSQSATSKIRFKTTLQDITKGDSKPDIGHSLTGSIQQHTNNLHEESPGESARMAFMSKYLPNSGNRNNNSSSSTTINSPSGVSNQNNNNNNNTSNKFGSNPGVKEPFPNPPVDAAMEFTPSPPERPPKKPHLRGNSQQVSDETPPPPLPRAPVRPPQPNLGKSTERTPVSTIPPPLPTKPQGTLSHPARCPSPDFLPPPPPPTTEEGVQLDDEPLPPPPTLSEVHNIMTPKVPSLSTLGSYLHKDSYMAQRKEKTLGYEGRYRRTLSPSGLTSRTPEAAQQQQSSRSNNNPVSPDQIPDNVDPESTLSPTAWEKYHNIRPPSTTVIFTSQELAKATSSTGYTNGLSPQQSQVPAFHRSISCDSNLFNNKTGFTQQPQNSVIGFPPVAQVAPLRGPQSSIPSELHHQIPNGSQPDLSQFSPQFHSTILESKVEAIPKGINNNTSSLTYRSPVAEDGTKNIPGPQYHDAGVQSTDFKQNRSYSLNQSPMVKVSPLRSITFGESPTPTIIENKENIPNLSLSDENILSKNMDFRVTTDASSQTDSGNEDEFPSEKSSNQVNEIGSERGRDRSLMAMEPALLSSLRGLSSSPSTCSSSSSTCSAGDLCNVLYPGRQKSQEELECEELSRDLVKQLPQGDKLLSLLVPLPDRKTSADYMEGLFNIQPKEAKKEQDEIDAKGCFDQSSNHLDSIESKSKDDGSCHGSPQPRLNDSEIVLPNENVHKRSNGHAPLPADSAYFTTSECKAKFLTQYVNDIHSESVSQTDDGQELNKQKEELVSRISKKLEILRIEQSDIREEINGNEQLGQSVVERVKETAKRNEFDKFKLHVEEIEKITSLLLGLSGRLARAENALMALNENPSPQEKRILESKRDKLKDQLDEAKVLKESIDRRSAQVAGFLEKYLSPEEYADYHHFTKMKAKLIIDAREIDEKIKLGEEQMLALQETLK